LHIRQIDKGIARGEGLRAQTCPIWKLAMMTEKKTMTTSPPEKGRPVVEFLTSVMISQPPNLRNVRSVTLKTLIWKHWRGVEAHHSPSAYVQNRLIITSPRPKPVTHAFPSPVFSAVPRFRT
jgi:hypothetical protein